jgi:pyruvate carboxylase
MYSDFESGMLSGSARVYEHQIPGTAWSFFSFLSYNVCAIDFILNNILFLEITGGQYSNLLVQCRSMGLWSRWEEVMDAYRDANRVLGDIVKVTPSSKCVGDLALYLVTRNLTAADLLDESKAGSIDFPESVVGLFRGDLGFPHLGFPAEVERAVLRGNISEKRTVRAGLTLPSEDLVANVAALSQKYGYPLTPEEGMSSIMYPKVFADYMKRQEEKGGELLRHLPSPVYFHGMKPGQEFTMKVPASLAGDVCEVPEGSSDSLSVSVKLDRIAPMKKGHRELSFTINGMVQVANIKDSTGAFVFDGPMADAGVAGQLGSPMPGVVEKVLVTEGQDVEAGDTLVTISAMKMEVKVTAPFAGKVGKLFVPLGGRVVEAALLVTLV